MVGTEHGTTGQTQERISRSCGVLRGRDLLDKPQHLTLEEHFQKQWARARARVGFRNISYRSVADKNAPEMNCWSGALYWMYTCEP